MRQAPRAFRRISRLPSSRRVRRGLDRSCGRVGYPSIAANRCRGRSARAVEPGKRLAQKQRIIGLCRSDADENRIASPPQFVNDPMRTGVADSYPRPSCAGHFAIGGLSPLQRDVGTTMHRVGNERRQQLPATGIVGLLHLDCGFAKLHHAAAVDLRIGIEASDDNPGHLGGDEFWHARRRFFVEMTARFERHIDVASFPAIRCTRPAPRLPRADRQITRATLGRSRDCPSRECTPPSDSAQRCRGRSWQEKPLDEENCGRNRLTSQAFCLVGTFDF